MNHSDVKLYYYLIITFIYGRISLFNRKIILLIFVFASLVLISAVSAAENSQNQTAGEDIQEDALKSVSIVPTKLSTTYGSGKSFKVKVVDTKTKKPAANVRLLLKVFSGKKSKKVSLTTDSGGVAKYSASKLNVGKHKVIVNVKDTKKISSISKTSKIIIKKAKLKIFAPKITNHYNVNKQFKITVKNKEGNIAMKGVKLLIKVFTGKKYKKYSLKTNKNGVVKINTKSLNKGKHKVTVNVKESSKVKKASAKSKITTVENALYVKLKANGKTLSVKLANNKATNALVEKLKKGDVKIRAREYGGFEKVGDLGFSLPTDDKYISTAPGDIVLYEGDQVSIFYDSNSWEYTKIGKVQKVTSKELKNILGSGDVVLVFSLK